jgi:hypothetical protein
MVRLAGWLGEGLCMHWGEGDDRWYWGQSHRPACPEEGMWIWIALDHAELVDLLPIDE